MGGARRVRYRHLRRTVIAVLATVAFVLLFGMPTRALLNAEPTRRMAVRWIERIARGYGATGRARAIPGDLLNPSVGPRAYS